MLTQDFDFKLPEILIAQHPCEKRSESNLLVVNVTTGKFSNRIFHDLPNLLFPGDLLVFNDTRVIPAAISSFKISGGRVKLLVERLLDEKRLLVHIYAKKIPKIGQILILDNELSVKIIKEQNGLFEIETENNALLIKWLDKFGSIPLPPYIKRLASIKDAERYQTVYARNPGAVASPTAGLHFDRKLINKITEIGIDIAFITLHIGAATFKKVRTSSIKQHYIHREIYEVNYDTCKKIEAAKNRGGRIIAVGTTAVRALETITDANGISSPSKGETEIFIYPGYNFRCVDAMITNFHSPKSTPLMLVAAFAGLDLILDVYNYAISNNYRFLSYGDAMFLTKLTRNKNFR